MSRFKSWAARTARSLSAHLDRLRDTLERLHGRLREAVAEAVGGSVASTAQDAVREALVHPAVAPVENSRSFRRPSRPWDEPNYHDPWAARDEDYYSAYRQEHRYDEEPNPYEADDQADEPSSSKQAQASRSRSSRWGLALAAGCQATAWWLQRQKGRFAALAALGVGLTSAVAAYVAGPVLAAGAGLAGSALALAALSDAARAGAAFFCTGAR
ncbi:MAG TPA: hypothetical protein VMS17_23175 [Gemmataceae bacterium]|nr:hypothetical protein [Gemmataceae bacterium]